MEVISINFRIKMHLIKFQYSILIFGSKLLNLSESECSHLLKKKAVHAYLIGRFYEQ